ncbi:MAG TPA: molybdenum ABC transporter ATP-binding protein [Steroidobacteraceae bacterium]|nr:molybdenum ABC transporter ATP-binding protein [Steroidobacteraceae bacterium]
MLTITAYKRRNDFTLDADFATPTPGVVALFGRSGCGKTTVIDIIAGLLAPDAGRVQLDDEVLLDTREGIRVPAERRRIGYVFQDSRLFPHRSVLGNLTYGQKRAARVAHAIELDEVVTLLGLTTLLARRPHELSGGERQRVALGRALLSQPRLLLLDEPLASLDAARREEVLPYLTVLRDRLSIPMVYVSHQFEEVLRLATHVVVMENGRVKGQGSLNEVSLLPALRSIVGSEAVGAVIEGTVLSSDDARGFAQLRIGAGTLQVAVRDAPVGAQVRVQLLARDIILATEAPRSLSVRNALHGYVAELIPDGDDAVLVRADIGAGAMVLSRVTQGAVSALDLQPGSSVWVLVKAVSTRGHAFRITPR